jgi:hypothetical protein
MHTKNQFIQDTAFSDGQIFLGPSGDFIAVGGTAPTLATAGVGLLGYTLGTASSTYNLFSPISQILRTGYAPLFQEQFGTAASVPGPTAVANTSDPEALQQGFPPILSANNPTIHGPFTGYRAKGIQINYVDVIYNVATAALTAATIGLTKTKFVNNVAPLVTNYIALANNGLPLPIQANPYVTRITVATPAFDVDTDSELILNINLSTGAASTTSIFYGCVLGISFNFN